MVDSLCYTGCGLDRACDLRRDPASIEALYREPRSVIIPIWQHLSFIAEGDPPLAALATGTLFAAIIEGADQLVLLGTGGEGEAWFAADFSSKNRETIAQMIGRAIPVPLRRVGAIMAPDHAAVLAYAQGIIHWHRRHRFCGVCGSATESREGGHIRVCARATCGAEHFPRTDPAVIMLVSRHDHEACLLARQARWPRGMYSTLAGFVEPGESLEEAVAREVWEEAGVSVTNIRYRGSQPWPFPSSIMLGFHADAETDAAIRFDPRELQDAQWFTRADIVRFDQLGLRLPSRDSIARCLINEWLNQAP
jgi:NAD+ diphosphatase